jgi:hypothetical protein
VTVHLTLIHCVLTLAIAQQNPPLYLHITSTSKAGLEAAVEKINDLIKQELPQLVDERDEFGRVRYILNFYHSSLSVANQSSQRKWPDEKIPITLEPIPGFNLRAQVVGHGGAYVKHIQQETGCRVQIKGRGSGYLEAATNLESDEDMFLHVTYVFILKLLSAPALLTFHSRGPDPNMVAKAKELCEDLIANVKEQYEEFKARPPRYNNDRGGYGDHHHHRGSHDRSHGGSHHKSYNSYNRYNSDSGATNSPAPAASSQQSAADYAAQYAQYYNGADPYAAYGGYAK